jgi:hypothetical protein
MTIFQHFRSTSIGRVAISAAALLMVAAIPAVSQEGSKADPDRVLKGGGLPPGWAVRPDRPGNTNLTMDGSTMHFSMSSAGTFFNPGWSKTGNYTYSARMSQPKAASHNISYGLMFGGTNLGTPMQSYSYFLIRQNGQYFVANWEGEARGPIVTNWTANDAIVKQGADGKQVNTMGVEVQGNNVILKVNGTEVGRLQESQVHTDGMIGFRIGHNLDVDVDQVSR